MDTLFQALQKRTSVLAWALAAALGAATAPVCAVEPLTLRVSDMEGAPGEVVTLVLRTYSPRALGQGQICLRSQNALSVGSVLGSTAPFSELLAVEVFAANGDVTSAGELDPGGAIAMIGFDSPTAAVNLEGGPLAAIHLRLAPDLTPGSTFTIEVDLPNTELFGPGGEPVVFEPRSGTLTVLAVGANKRLAIDDDRVPPGGFLELGVQTLHPFLIGSGSVEITWPSGFTVGTPTVWMDPRHGNATFTADVSVPNRVAVTFSSPDGTLNRVSGEIIEISVQTLPTAPDSTGPIDLTITTTLLDPASQPITLNVIDGTIEIERRDAIFLDSFESGAANFWSSVSP